MEELMDILPIAVIICFAVFTVLVVLVAVGVKVKGNENAPQTVDELYGAWNNQSKIVRVSIAIRLIFIAGNLAIAGYFALGLLMGVEPMEFFRGMIDYDNAGDEEIFRLVKRLTCNYFFGYIAVLVGFWLLISLFNMFSTFSLAKWINKRNIDCYPLINRSEGNFQLRTVSRGYLVSAQPSVRIIFLVDYALRIAASVAFVWALRKFLLRAVADAYTSFFGDAVEPKMRYWLRTLLVSREAIVIYAIFAVAAAVGIAVWAILNKKQKELLKTEAECRGKSDL